MLNGCVQVLFATLLGIISMVPITLLVILPVFKPSTFHWSTVSGFHFAAPKTAGFAFVMSWLFVMSWNGIGVEGAACYVAECRNPQRDAKIAMTAEGLYGLFIYAATAIVFVAVLGASLKSSDPLTEYTNFAGHIFGSGGWVRYLIGIPLIGALMLSVLNAIMGVGRSLFQASEDRLIPKFFAHKNKHHSPDLAMFFNLACALVVALFGSPVRIYIFSNVGYLLAIVVALVGYFFVRQFRKELKSPFRLPGIYRWIALAMAMFLTFAVILFTSPHESGTRLASALIGAIAAPMIFELPFDLIVMARVYPPVQPDPAAYRALFFVPLFLVEITTLLLLRLSPMVKLSRGTFFAFAAMLVVFAVWSLTGFAYPSAALPTALNVVSKLLAFATALSLFLPQRRKAAVPEPAPVKATVATR